MYLLSRNLLLFSFLLLVATPWPTHAGTWVPTGPFKIASPAFAVLPGVSNTVLVSNGDTTVRSADGGGTFSVVAGVKGFRMFAAGAAGSNVVYGFDGSFATSRSNDGGMTWQATGGVALRELAVVAPTNPLVVYGTFASSGLIRSTDGGATFTTLGGFQALPALALVVSPIDEKVVYAGTLGPLFKTVNGGATFTQIGPPGATRARAIAIDPTDASVLYCLFANVLYKSVDAGATFAQLPVAITALSNTSAIDASIAIDPADHRQVFVAIRGGSLWRSTDAGATWSGPLTIPGSADQVRASNAALYAVGDRIYRSTDQGTTWTALDAPLSNEEIRNLASSPLSPARVFAAGNTGNYRSLDNGRHFEPVAVPPPSTSIRSDGRFHVDSARPDFAYFAVGGGISGPPQLYRSTDGGATWPLLYAPPAIAARPAESFDAFASSPIPGRLFVVSAAYGGGAFRASYLHRSADDGVSWSSAPIVSNTTPAPVQYVQSLILDPRTPMTMYLAAAGFHRSVDGGVNWTAGGAPFDKADTSTVVTALALIPATPATSTTPTIPTTLLASTGLGVYRSTDGGVSWTLSSEGLPAVTITGLAVDPDNGNTVYAALYFGGGVFQSNDAGHTWHPFSTGLSTLSVFTALVTGGSVFAGTTQGVQRCADQACAGGKLSQRVSVVEFYNTQLDHYFMTANAPEIASIDSGGAGPGWVRTNVTFNAWATALDAPYDASQIYRFYGTPNIGPNSHFYTISSSEFANVQKDRGWTYEVGNWFWMKAPAASGACPADTAPIYRAYNNRFAVNDSNHRYTSSPAVLQDMKNRGWIVEGAVLCTPF